MRSAGSGASLARLTLEKRLRAHEQQQQLQRAGVHPGVFGAAWNRGEPQVSRQSPPTATQKSAEAARVSEMRESGEEIRVESPSGEATTCR